jgi:hypothetical protein
MPSSLRNAAPLDQNSPILPAAKYVNIPAANGVVPSNPANAFLNYGCRGSPPWVTNPSSSAINLPFSENNLFKQTGGYRYRKSRKAGKLRHKKSKKRHRKHKYSKKRKSLRKHKKSKRKMKGGSRLPLGFGPASDTNNKIVLDYQLENLPYSQGYTINDTDPTDYGRLANPIPHKAYAKCPPKLKFN